MLKEQLQPRLSRYAFRYSWNFYPCSIFQRVCFLNIYCIVDFVWTERATNCFVDIGCLFIFVPNLFVCDLPH